LSDLRERLAAPIVRRFDELIAGDLLHALIPIVEAELAQATADALDMAAQLIERMPAREWLHMTQEDWATSIRELIPADIAVRAKERECSRCHESKQCLAIPLDTGAHEQLCAECISLMLGEAHELMGAASKSLVAKDVRESEIKTALSILVENSPGAALNAVTEDFPWLVEGLAKIRWEAYLDASVLGCYCVCHSPTSSRPSCLHCHPEHFEQGHADPYCGLTLGAIQRLRKWANEPPSGGKADGG
jgi:hypothetical protein